MQYKSSLEAIPGNELGECTLGPTICGYMEECRARAPFDKVSVSEFIDGSVPDFYTWRYADDGNNLEQLFLTGLCDVSLQKGRKITTQEATRIARTISVIPEVEFTQGIANAWWLWVVSIISAITLFLTSQDSRFDPDGDIDESRRRDPILILKRSFDYQGRFDVVQWLIVVLFWTGVNSLLWLISENTQSYIFDAVQVVILFTSAISTWIASVRRFYDYQNSSLRFLKPKHWIGLAGRYLVFNICLLLFSIFSLYLDLLVINFILFLISLLTTIVALHIARPQTLRINKTILMTIARLLTIVLSVFIVVTIWYGVMIILESDFASYDWQILLLLLYCLISLALSQRVIRQLKRKPIEMDSDAGDIINAISQDNYDG